MGGCLLLYVKYIHRSFTVATPVASNSRLEWVVGGEGGREGDWSRGGRGRGSWREVGGGGGGWGGGGGGGGGGGWGVQVEKGNPRGGGRILDLDDISGDNNIGICIVIHSSTTDSLSLIM